MYVCMCVGMFVCRHTEPHTKNKCVTYIYVCMHVRILDQCIEVCECNRWNGIRRKGKQADAHKAVRLWPCGGDRKFHAKSKAGLCTHRKRCVAYARAKGRDIDVALIPCGGDCGFSAKSNAGLWNHRRSRGCANHGKGRK